MALRCGKDAAFFEGEGRLPSYHFACQIIGRSKGRSVLAAAAYRAGVRLIQPAYPERDVPETVFDYTRRKGVVFSDVLLPEGADPKYQDRQTLWQEIETVWERRVDAQLAREFNFALPAELSAEERQELALNFVRDQFVARGMACQIDIHAPTDGDDPRNHHCHVLTTLRKLGPEGFFRTKTREWNSDEALNGWRAAWAEAQNLALERAGRRERVDHRSLAAQRTEAAERGDFVRAVELDRQPEIHVGPKARKARQRGADLKSQVRGQATARPRAGRWTSSRDASRRTRSIDYPALDRGDRGGYLEQLILGRLSANQKLLARRERQAARIRDRFLTYEKIQRTGQKRGLTLHHVKGRAKQAHNLVQLIEQLTRAITRSLNRDRSRQRALVTPRDIDRALGIKRGRKRVLE